MHNVDTGNWTRPPAGVCPLCGAIPAEPLLSLSLSQRTDLPTEITLSACAACDFAYTAPADAQAYDRYYTANTNDQMSVHKEISALDAQRYVKQAEALSEILGCGKSLRILDVGCGEAGLLRTLALYFPHHRYYGSDLNVKEAALGGEGGIRFNRSWKELDQRFDLIILSHVLEHIVDLRDFSRIVELLVPDGKMYIEVPDAAHYVDAPRREYCYYVDRLHVNHFSLASLSDLMRSWGLGIRRVGTQNFPYKDGNPFPACYAIGERAAASVAGADLPRTLPLALASYLGQERGRSRGMLAGLNRGEEIVVYGFGDNFFRSCSLGGPLDGCPIRAVVDRNWVSLSQSAYADHYRFMDLDAALRTHPSLPFVVTVSWGGETIAKMLSDAGTGRVLIL